MSEKSSHTIEYGLWTRFYEVCTRLNNTKNHRVVDFLQLMSDYRVRSMDLIK